MKPLTISVASVVAAIIIFGSIATIASDSQEWDIEFYGTVS